MLIAPEVFATYVLACIVVVIVPGPTVTVIIANSLAHGSRAGFWNVAGTQAGLAVMIGILVVGLASIIETMAWWFDWVRIAGALYLIWIGWKLLRSARDAGTLPAAAPSKTGNGFFWQGVLVIFANPKALLFFGAFIPQFIDPAGNYIAQTILLGAPFMAVATVLDGAYALLAGRAGRWLSGSRMRIVQGASGLFLIGGGIWLATLRRA